MSRIATGLYVSRSQLKRDRVTLKDALLVRELNDNIVEYEKILIQKIGTQTNRYTAKQLAEIIKSHITTPEVNDIDFGAFCKEYLRKLRERGQMGLAFKREAAFNNFATFFGSEKIPVKEINVRNLSAYMEYLSKPHKVRSVSPQGEARIVTKKGCSPQTIKEYIAGLQTLFNAACDEYNDEDTETMLITHRPFKSKKLQIAVKTQPAKRDMPIEDLVKILAAKDLPSHRMELARDVLAISLYLLAMNTIDIYGADAKLKIRRVEYHRQKTASRRKDEAFLSVKIEPELLPLLRKYRDPKKKRLFNFYRSYSSYQTFYKAVNLGCKQLAEHLELDFPLSSYYIRHTWATLAAESCGCSDEDVALALNHVGENTLRVTRGYIHRKFTRNDINHRKVLDLIAGQVG